MSEVHVLAIISTKPGLRDTVLDLFRDNAEKVRAEDGCIQYEAGIDCDEELSFQTEFGSDTFVVIEKWDSTESLK